MEDIDGLIDELAEIRRRMSALHARELTVLAAALDVTVRQAAGAASADHDIPLRSMSAQIAAELRASDRTVQHRLSTAAIVVSAFPATLSSLHRGEIDRVHADVIVDAGLAIDDPAARAAYEQAALEVARRETPGRLRPAVKTLAARLHPIEPVERHRTAAASRGVWVRDLDDGMAELVAHLAAPLAHGIHDRLTALVRAGGPSGASVGAGGGASGEAAADSPADPRKMSERRADALTDLLLTGHPTAEASASSIAEADAVVARVQITIPVMTLLGHDDAPAELAGHGPIDLDTARALAAGALGWDRVLVHPISGHVLAVDRYRPSEHLRRTLRVRDEHCRFPGCRQPAPRCDIDHTIAREHDGPTEVTNLAHLCRRHHTLKHHSAWRVRQRPDGVLEWTSPIGRVYPDTPRRTLTFEAAAPPGREDSSPPGLVESPPF